MKRIIVIALAFVFSVNVRAQDMKSFKLYKPTENAEVAIASAVKEAKAEGKHVFVQIGGNWCIWCARFNDFVTTDKSIDSLISANYVVYHMNYSEENQNDKLLAKFGYPQRFGFPVFLVLDGDGKLLHTQNSSYLEEGKGYNKNTVVGFFKDWTAKALDPAQYKSK